MLKEKSLSILGDSISTYQGISNDESAHPSIGYHPYYYRDPFPPQKTYWAILLRRLGLTLCVNNSWSGGNLSGRDDPDSGINRAACLARSDGTIPHIIIVFMGINDLGRGIASSVFAADYQGTLAIIKETYPHAAVCCVNLPDRDPTLKMRTEVFNEVIAQAVAAAGDRFFVADLFGSRLNNECYYMNTLDGLHPDEDGMSIIADAVETAIRANCQNLL